MSRIIIPGKSAHPDFALPRKQPVGPVEVDWTNPITRNLSAYVDFARQKNVVDGQKFTLSGSSVSLSPTAKGMGADFTRSTLSAIRLSPTAFNTSTNNWSAIALVYLRSSPTDTSTITASSLETSGATSFQFRVVASGLLQVCLPGLAIIAQSTGIISTGEWRFVGVSYNYTTNTSNFFIDGADAGASTAGFTATMDGAVIGANYNNASYNWDGKIAFVSYWKRAISAEEHRQIARSPYQFLRPANKPTFFIPNASTTKKVIPLPKRSNPDFALPGRQPVGRVTIDWTNPLARGLACEVSLNGGLLNSVKGSLVTNGGGFGYAPTTRGGLGANLNGSSQYVAIPASQFTPSTTAWTYAFTFKGQLQGERGFISAWDNISGGRNIYFYTLSASLILDIPYLQGNIISVAGPTSSVTRYLLTRSGSTVTLYVDGVYFSQGTITATQEVPTNSFYIGAGGPLGGEDYQLGVMADFRAWNRAFSAVEAREEYRNPYQIFRPANDNVFFLPSSALATIPVLSAATVLNITATTATPRVTVTF